MESMPPVAERTVSAAYALALARYPDKAAHIGDGQTWTFTDSHQRSLRIAGGLAALGVQRQQTVEFAGELPKTPTHKVLKHLLRDRGVTDGAWDREAAGIILRRDGHRG